MRILKFKKLTLKNFLSIGSVPIELDFKQGLHLITGYDRDKPDEKNGIGKTSICESVLFVLFNETNKNLKLGELVNDKNKKNCEVKLEFSIINNGKLMDYEIIRTLKPSNCILKINGEDVSLSSIPQTNAKISRILGVSKELFKQSVIMSIGSSISFFKLGKSEKRKFIEGIFNLGIFSEMLNDSRVGYNETRKEKEYVQTQLTNEKNRLSQFEEKNNSFEDSKKQFIDILKTQIEEDLEKINKLNKSLKNEQSIWELNETLTDLNEKLTKIENLRFKIEVKLSEINNRIKTLSDEIANFSDICSNCGQPYSDKETRREINKNKQKEINKLSILRTEYLNSKKTTDDRKELFDRQRDEIKIQISSIKNISDHNKTIKSHIATLKKTCLNNKEKILSKSEEVSKFDDLIEEVKEEIKSLDSEYKKLFKDNKVYDFCKFILSEEGVRSVIVKQLKDFLNYKINYYLDNLGSALTCSFDEYFSETIYNKNGIEKSYGAFSGGESKRIDLAVLLTFQDILREQSGIDIKLAFYDEILDTSICETGRKNVLKILKKKSENEICIYIISHRRKMSDLIDNEIILEKHNDFTYLKEIK